MPVGSIDNQPSRSVCPALRAAAAEAMPTGFLTMLMSDIEGSTALLDVLDDRYGELILFQLGAPGGPTRFPDLRT